tara:strand:+ start:315 stop:548 length:234 start_codon:yes stop_codon:yes gene_type:complete
MESNIEKQILQFQEELSKQIKNRDQAKKVFDECTNNINALQGGIQFGEILLKKIESSDQQLDTVEPNPQSKTAPSQK